MLNEVDFEIENEDSESKSKVQLLKTYSIVTSSPSVSTIVSLSDGGVSRINKYSIASNETRQFKDFMYEDKALKDPTNTFVYKKSISVLNTTHNKGYCIQKKMAFDSSGKPFKSNIEDTPNSSNDFGVFCRYEEQLSSLLNSIRLTSVSVDDCIGLWDIVINKDITNTIERYLNVNNKKATLFYLRYLELLSIMLSCVFGKCINDTIKKRLIELMRVHYRIMMSILKWIIEQNATLPNHMLNQLKKLINRRDLNYKTSTSTSTSTSTTLNHRSKSNHLDNGDEYYFSLILNYINTIASIHQEIILYQPEELKAMDKDVICRINDIMQNEALFSMNDIDMIFKSKIIPAVSFNHDHNSTSTVYANVNANANQGNNHRKLLEKIDLKTPKLFLNKESLKEYTLVLALQNTLINYIKENDDDDEGVVKFRPGLHEFLSNCCLYYELVVFTCLPKEVCIYILLIRITIGS